MKVLIDDKIQTYSADEIARWTAQLPEWRRERLEAIKHDAGRRQSLLAFRLLCQGLREEYGIAELPPFSFNEHNKPLWDEGLALPHFSLSHCREAVACVIDERPCGIDIESRGRKVSDSLIRYAMNEEEKRALCALIYYPDERIELVKRAFEEPTLTLPEGKKFKSLTEWYKVRLGQVVEIARAVTIKYSRSKVQKLLPPDYAYIIGELLHESHLELKDRNTYYNAIIDAIIETGCAEQLLIAISYPIHSMSWLPH